MDEVSNFCPAMAVPMHREDAGADDRADAQRGQRPRAQRLFQPMLGLLRVGDQLVDGLAAEQLVRQISAPERGDESRFKQNC